MLLFIVYTGCLNYWTLKHVWKFPQKHPKLKVNKSSMNWYRSTVKLLVCTSKYLLIFCVLVLSWGSSHTFSISVVLDDANKNAHNINAPLFQHGPIFEVEGMNRCNLLRSAGSVTASLWPLVPWVTPEFGLKSGPHQLIIRPLEMAESK